VDVDRVVDRWWRQERALTTRLPQRTPQAKPGHRAGPGAAASASKPPGVPTTSHLRALQSEPAAPSPPSAQHADAEPRPRTGFVAQPPRPVAESHEAVATESSPPSAAQSKLAQLAALLGKKKE
jgi:hypothetical protein